MAGKWASIDRWASTWLCWGIACLIVGSQIVAAQVVNAQATVSLPASEWAEPAPPASGDLIRAGEAARVDRVQYLDDDSEQNAPGAAYTPRTAPLPSYFYSPDYYNRQYGGIRPAADYAPPGYFPRDQQEGPAVPEYTPLYPPLPITPEERDKFVTQGLIPGSILAPGTNTSILFRGFIRLAAMYDFEPIGVADAFVTNSIPVPQEDGANVNFSARISRFSVETWTPTSFSDWNVHTRIEGDFFNGPPQASGGGGNPFRLRHAYVDFGPFRFGQQNTTFMDPSSWPSLVDFRGPNSRVNQRQPSARITLPIADRTFWAMSAERPFSDIATHGLGDPVQDVPDFGTHLRYQGDLGHFQLGGLLRTIGYRPTDDEVTRRVGAGISGSFVYHPWAFLMGTDPLDAQNASGLTRSRTILQGTWGSGVGRYLSDLLNQNLDAQVDPNTGAFDLVRSGGWNASYEHWYNQTWLTNITYGNVSASSNVDQPGTTYNGSQYAAASLWWIPVPGVAFAVEYVWGERENLDGQTGEAQRLHSMFQYNF